MPSATTSILNPLVIIPKKLVLRWKVNLKIFWGISLISIAFLLAFYVFQVNSLISGNYLFKNYEKKLDSLSSESNDLKIKFGKTSSLENINSRVQVLNFEKVNKIYYIQVLEGEIVKNK